MRRRGRQHRHHVAHTRALLQRALRELARGGPLRRRRHTQVARHGVTGGGHPWPHHRAVPQPDEDACQAGRLGARAHVKHALAVGIRHIDAERRLTRVLRRQQRDQRGCVTEHHRLVQRAQQTRHRAVCQQAGNDGIPLCQRDGGRLHAARLHALQEVMRAMQRTHQRRALIPPHLIHWQHLPRILQRQQLQQRRRVAGTQRLAKRLHKRLPQRRRHAGPRRRHH